LTAKAIGIPLVGVGDADVCEGLALVDSEVLSDGLGCGEGDTTAKIAGTKSGDTAVRGPRSATLVTGALESHDAVPLHTVDVINRTGRASNAAITA